MHILFSVVATHYVLCFKHLHLLLLSSSVMSFELHEWARYDMLQFTNYKRQLGIFYVLGRDAFYTVERSGIAFTIH